MIESLKNIFRVPDLRNRLLFTLGMLAVYRLGNHIPTPGVDARALTVHAHRFSAKAKETITGLGGKAEVLEG